jgi:hypothetical protein
MEPVGQPRHESKNTNPRIIGRGRGEVEMKLGRRIRTQEIMIQDTE